MRSKAAVVTGKKKVDYEALGSSFMRIPYMNATVARDLIDIGLRDIYELKGRCPEAIFRDVFKLRGVIPEDRVLHFRLAVYYAETPDPEASKLQLHYWNS